MEKYHKIKLGKYSEEKENFYFTFRTSRGEALTFVRHSETAIRNVVKDLGMSYATIIRDKDWWTVRQNLTQSWWYRPRY